MEQEQPSRAKELVPEELGLVPEELGLVPPEHSCIPTDATHQRGQQPKGHRRQQEVSARQNLKDYSLVSRCC